MSLFNSEAEEKIKQLRDEKSSIDYVLLGFDDPKKCEALKVLSSGMGGVEALKSKCPEGDVAYGMVRSVLKLKAEGSAAVSSVKFVYIHFRPSVIPLSRKMKIGILDGKIKKGFGSYHASIEAETADELSDDIVTKLLEDIAGITDRTGNREATVSATGQLTSASLLPKTNHTTTTTGSPGAVKIASNVRKTGTAADYLNVSNKGAAVQFQNESELESTLEAVKQGTCDWALWKYQDIKTLVKVGQGNGGLSALLDAAPSDSVAYGAFTVSDTLDVSTGKKGGISTKKFCFLVWTPDGVGAVKKAKIATHAGVVKTAFRKHYPYHFDYYVSNKDELSEKDVMAAIGKLTGTAELDSEAAQLQFQQQKKLEEQRANAKHEQNLGGVSKSSAGQLDVDKDALLNHLKAIRKDDAPNNFAIAYFDNDSAKLLIGPSGSGSVAAAVAAVPTESFSYLLLRLSEQIDASTVTRFLFVAVTPQSVPARLKCKFGSLFGRVKDLFSPFHATLSLDSPTELTPELANLTIRGDRAKNSAPS